MWEEKEKEKEKKQQEKWKREKRERNGTEQGERVVAVSHLPLSPSKPASDVLLLLPLYAAWPLLP